MCEKYENLNLRLSAIESRLNCLEDDQKAIKNDTGEMIAMFSALQGGFRTLQMIGRLARPFGYIAATVTAISVAWAKFKGGIQ